MTGAAGGVPGADPPPHAPANDPRINAVATGVAARLRAACEGWDAAEFEALVERIARTKVRWADLGYGE